MSIKYQGQCVPQIKHHCCAVKIICQNVDTYSCMVPDTAGEMDGC